MTKKRNFHIIFTPEKEKFPLIEIPTLKIYLLGVCFEVKFEFIHKKLYFPLEFIEKIVKQINFKEFLTVKQRNLANPPFQLQRNLSFLPWGLNGLPY